MQKVEIKISPDFTKGLALGGKTFRAAFDFRLTEADLKKSRIELGETEDVRNDSLRKLKEMLSEDKDIRYRTDDKYLIRYLRYRKFNCKEAYKRIRHFYLVRMEFPELFDIPAKFESLLNSEINLLLPYTDQEGRIIFLARYGKWKTDEWTVQDLLHLANNMSDIISMNPHAQINGIICIWDFKNTTLNHIAHAFRPSAARFWIKMIQELFPYRLERMIVVNCNAVQHACIVSVRYLLKKKIADRVTVLRSDMSQLHEYVNPALLPKEFGGSLEDSECYSYLQRPVLDNLQYLRYEHSFIGTQKR